MNDRIAYLAGFFDGEGCISGTRQRHRGKDGEWRGYYYGLQVAVGQKYPRPLQLFKEEFGGILYEYIKKSTLKMTYNDGQEKIYIGGSKWLWITNGQNARLVLETLLPFLVVKREQALVGIEMMNLRLNKRTRQDQRQQGPEYYWRLRELKKKVLE